jgi:hypothetical protein
MSEDSKHSIRKLISEEDLRYVRYEIRVKLLLNFLSKEKFIKQILSGYNDTISIQQLAQELSKSSLQLSEEDSETFARYVIEPRGKVTIEYTAKRSKEIEVVKESLEMALEIAYTFNSNKELKEITKQTLEKVKTRIPYIIQQYGDTVDVDKWIEIFQGMDLYQIEDDVLMSIGFENTKDTRKLSLKVIKSKQL